MDMTHDVIVIGGGSGGVAGSRRAAAHGAKVAIVEADRFGGTCVIRGCVPKKLMMYAAGFAHQFKEAEGFGWRDVQARFEMAGWADAKAREIGRLEHIYDEMLVNGGVETVRGHGRLVSANEVDVDGRLLAAPRPARSRRRHRPASRRRGARGGRSRAPSHRPSAASRSAPARRSSRSPRPP